MYLTLPTGSICNNCTAIEELISAVEEGDGGVSFSCSEVSSSCSDVGSIVCCPVVGADGVDPPPLSTK